MCKTTYRKLNLKMVFTHIKCELSDVVYLIYVRNVTNTMWVKLGMHSDQE